MSGADLFPSVARLAWEREREARPFSAAEIREEIARVAKPGATVVVWGAPAPHLVLLPGDLLGRVTGRAPDHGLACVERWGGGRWHAFGVERCERLRVEGVEGHHHYAAASAAAGDAPAPIV